MAHAMLGRAVWTGPLSPHGGDLIDDLLGELRARARAQNDAREVRLIETHVLWVLLGPEVYKIKKPVRLPFLDQSSLEQRKLGCDQELVVNRRLAPRSYLGVVPIRRREDGRATLGGSTSPIVEWAVRMVRRDEALSATALLEKAALTPSMLRSVR